MAIEESKRTYNYKRGQSRGRAETRGPPRMSSEKRVETMKKKKFQISKIDREHQENER